MLFSGRQLQRHAEDAVHHLRHRRLGCVAAHRWPAAAPAPPSWVVAARSRSPDGCGCWSIFSGRLDQLTDDLGHADSSLYCSSCMCISSPAARVLGRNQRRRVPLRLGREANALRLGRVWWSRWPRPWPFISSTSVSLCAFEASTSPRSCFALERHLARAFGPPRARVLFCSCSCANTISTARTFQPRPAPLASSAWF